MGQIVTRNITKRFGDVVALDGVSIDIAPSSIHAILGENGAGKTTLMNILFGLYQPDAGEILIQGHHVKLDHPSRAIAHGIGMVHQHFMLVDSLSVAENIVLGLPDQGVQLDLKNHAEEIRSTGRYFGFDIDPWQRVGDLPIGIQQRVEILKALYRDANILIMDEPTSVLTPSEVSSFLDAVSSLRDKGCTIIFITHKLDEVMAVADTVSVLRHGRVAGVRQRHETSVAELARLMVGRDVPVNIQRTSGRAGGVALRLEGITTRRVDRETTLDGVTFEVREGEILGVAGVDGNGQAELAEVIAGFRPIEKGRIKAFGQDIDALSVEQRRRDIHIGFVPEDRQRTGLVLDYPAPLNLALRKFMEPPFANHGILNFAAMQRHAETLIKRYDVRLGGLAQNVRYLSGGNQQKLVLAREIEAKPKILVVAQPCKGLDVGATEFVQNKLVAERTKGLAILYISTELDHILEVSDRIAVMCDGRITGILTRAEATPDKIGMLMAGIDSVGEAHAC